MDISLWGGHFVRPETLQLHDDLGRIDFSYILGGTPRFATQRLRRHTDQELTRNRHYTAHAPDHRGNASYCGRSESITFPLSPETPALWVPGTSAVIKNKIDSHCCYQQQRCNAETRLAAQASRHTLMRMHGGFSYEQKPSTLWLQGQSLVMLGLVLDEHREDTSCLSCHLSPMERQKLLRAKDLLLADLTQTPDVAELVRESGLSVLKIKQGFRVLFNNNVYGLFQAGRMQEAGRHLAGSNTSVMTMAADLGYTNASHFPTASQRQFGVTPSISKRGMQSGSYPPKLLPDRDPDTPSGPPLFPPVTSPKQAQVGPFQVAFNY